MARRDEKRALRMVVGLLVLGLVVRAFQSRPPPQGGALVVRRSSVPVELDSVLEASRRLARPLRPGERVDVDRASAADLSRLPGIGPALATRIVLFRDSVGGIGSLDALDAVAGIGPHVLQSISRFVEFSAPQARRNPTTDRVRINTAGLEELERLPGIGPAKAEAIIEYRRAHGRFARVEDLVAVPGIGAATLEGLRPRVRIP
ncbi:MAG: ComEA family DNA-binding protein [Gemmatimonadales bacterium]